MPLRVRKPRKPKPLGYENPTGPQVDDKIATMVHNGGAPRTKGVPSEPGAQGQLPPQAGGHTSLPTDPGAGAGSNPASTGHHNSIEPLLGVPAYPLDATLFTRNGEAVIEPPEHLRQYVRRGGPNGDLGYIVEVNGIRHVRLDRATLEVVPWTAAHWVPSDRFRPISAAQQVMVAQQADALLCKLLGLMEDSRKNFMTMTDQERNRWLTRGPPGGNRLRKRLYNAIRAAFAIPENQP